MTPRRTEPIPSQRAMFPHQARLPEERCRPDRAVPRFSGFTVWDGVAAGVVTSKDCPQNGVFDPPDHRPALAECEAPPLPYQRQGSPHAPPPSGPFKGNGGSLVADDPKTPRSCCDENGQPVPPQSRPGRSAPPPTDPNVATLQIELKAVEARMKKLERVVRVQADVIKHMAEYGRALSEA